MNHRDRVFGRENQKSSSTCLLLSKAEVALAQVQEYGLVELGKPGVHLALG